MIVPIADVSKGTGATDIDLSSEPNTESLINCDAASSRDFKIISHYSGCLFYDKEIAMFITTTTNN